MVSSDAGTAPTNKPFGADTRAGMAIEDEKYGGYRFVILLRMSFPAPV